MAYYGNQQQQPGAGGFHQGGEADEAQQWQGQPQGQPHQSQHGGYGYSAHEEPPYIHPGYQHQATYSYDDQYQQQQQPYGLQPVQPYDQGDNDEPNTRPDHHAHWIQAAPPGPGPGAYSDDSGMPGFRHSDSNESETFGGVNPFDTPGATANGGVDPLSQQQHQQPGMASNEDIPLLTQAGGQHLYHLPGQGGRSAYGDAMGMAGGASAGPGGFADPNALHAGADEEEESQVRYGRIPQRIPRRLKTIKQGASCKDASPPAVGKKG